MAASYLFGFFGFMQVTFYSMFAEIYAIYGSTKASLWPKTWQLMSLSATQIHYSATTLFKVTNSLIS
jgi:hypothetical protein